jgi:uncharacterized protein (DUF608 family)
MRQCNCSGHCGPQTDGLSRREFLELAAAGTAGALVAGSVHGATFELPPDEFARWKRDLFAPAKPRVYSSAVHKDARLHLGGIGTGNIEIGADGQFTRWQLFNTLRDGQVPLYFLLKAGNATKLLQTAGGPDWPRVPRIEMTGDYPFARLRFLDDDLPVSVELEAFTPMVPLDTRVSSLPVAVLSFDVRNRSAQPIEVSLAALMQNPVGYDATGRIDGVNHAKFGGNVNEPLREATVEGVFLRAESGKEPSLDRPVSIFTAANLQGLTAPPPDRPENLTLEVFRQAPPAASRLTDPAHSVIWLEEAGADLSEAVLQAAREAVQAGATLVLGGQAQPLLRAYAAATEGRPLGEASARSEIVFEDFERGYENWQVEGEAFGKAPARGTLPNQQRVSGFAGKGLVNTYLNGDDTTGKLTSRPFTIERHFIRFLIGGGRHATTQLWLVVDGKVVRAASGKDNERLEPMAWEVREFAGRTATLVIVDEQKGPWGHVNVDHIVFSDEPGNRAVLALLEELLPARFRGIQPAAQADPADPSRIEFAGLALRDGAKEITLQGRRRAFVRAVGRGQVAVTCGALLDPAQADVSSARQRAYAMLCELVGAKYSAGEGQSPKAPGFGTLALAVSHGAKSVRTSFADWGEAWQQFAAQGQFEPMDQAKASAPTPAGRTSHCAVATSMNLPPGERTTVHFFLTWHYPNKYNATGTAMGCHYAAQWPDARAVLREVTATTAFSALREKTELFRRTFYDSTLPWWLLDCVTANAAIIRHIGVVFRIAHGDCYGWEGSNGCCQPTCTHVWGYEQTLARLFPDLERDMRRIDFKHQQRADGGVNNRTDVPSPPRPTGEQPFADGHASCILKAYREALNSPDDGFFKEYWPHIRRAVDYLIGRDAKSHGGQPAGYLEDDQWNTYDEALHGVTTFISGYYLAALRAGEEWARRMGDAATADRFHAIFVKGQTKLVELCWEGEYFRQHLPGYEKMPGEVGPGCMSDQLIGQWWAHQLGLGYILPKDKVVSALKSVFKYNFKSDLTGWRHAPRAFAGAKDKGLIICTWPKGGRPGHVLLYSDEVWTGIEYQVAAHMIYEGLVEEGFAIVKAARDRYDGVPRPPMARNPWDEIECGGHYARAMSSWSLLLALSGWEYDGPGRVLRCGPRHRPENFRGFFAAPEGWGQFRQTAEGGRQKAEVSVAAGRLPVRLVSVALLPNVKPDRATVSIGGRSVPARLAVKDGRAEITLQSEAIIREGQAAELTLG